MAHLVQPFIGSSFSLTIGIGPLASLSLRSLLALELKVKSATALAAAESHLLHRILGRRTITFRHEIDQIEIEQNIDVTLTQVQSSAVDACRHKTTQCRQTRGASQHCRLPKRRCTDGNSRRQRRPP